MKQVVLKVSPYSKAIVLLSVTAKDLKGIIGLAQECENILKEMSNKVKDFCPKKVYWMNEKYCSFGSEKIECWRAIKEGGCRSYLVSGTYDILFEGTVGTIFLMNRYIKELSRLPQILDIRTIPLAEITTSTRDRTVIAPIVGFSFITLNHNLNSSNTSIKNIEKILTKVKNYNAAYLSYSTPQLVLKFTEKDVNTFMENIKIHRNSLSKYIDDWVTIIGTPSNLLKSETSDLTTQPTSSGSKNPKVQYEILMKAIPGTSDEKIRTIPNLFAANKNLTIGSRLGYWDESIYPIEKMSYPEFIKKVTTEIRDIDFARRLATRVYLVRGSSLARTKITHALCEEISPLEFEMGGILDIPPRPKSQSSDSAIGLFERYVELEWIQNRLTQLQIIWKRDTTLSKCKTITKLIQELGGLSETMNDRISSNRGETISEDLNSRIQKYRGYSSLITSTLTERFQFQHLYTDVGPSAISDSSGIFDKLLDGVNKIMEDMVGKPINGVNLPVWEGIVTTSSEEDVGIKSLPQILTIPSRIKNLQVDSLSIIANEAAKFIINSSEPPTIKGLLKDMIPNNDYVNLKLETLKWMLILSNVEKDLHDYERILSFTSPCDLEKISIDISNTIKVDDKEEIKKQLAAFTTILVSLNHSKALVKGIFRRIKQMPEHYNLTEEIIRFIRFCVTFQPTDGNVTRPSPARILFKIDILIAEEKDLKNKNNLEELRKSLSELDDARKAGNNWFVNANKISNLMVVETRRQMYQYYERTIEKDCGGNPGRCKTVIRDIISHLIGGVPYTISVANYIYQGSRSDMENSEKWEDSKRWGIVRYHIGKCIWEEILKIGKDWKTEAIKKFEEKNKWSVKEDSKKILESFLPGLNKENIARVVNWWVAYVNENYNDEYRPLYWSKNDQTYGYDSVNSAWTSMKNKELSTNTRPKHLVGIFTIAPKLKIPAEHVLQSLILNDII